MCVGGVGDGVGGVVVLIVSIMLASLAIVFDNACVVFGVLFRWRRCVCVCVGVVVGVCVCVCRRRCSAASVCVGGVGDGVGGVVVSIVFDNASLPADVFVE